jgi:hypothetical protein
LFRVLRSGAVQKQGQEYQHIKSHEPLGFWIDEEAKEGLDFLVSPFSEMNLYDSNIHPIPPGLLTQILWQ